MIELPFERTKAPEYDDISKLVLTAHQGTGKTATCAGLPNSLVIDFESGCKDSYQGQKIDLKKICAEQGISMGKAFMDTLEAIKLANKEKSGFAYDFIIYDGISALEKLIHQKATALFKNSVVGKGMINKGVAINDVVTDVPESGWLWFFRGFEDIYESTIGLAKVCTIYLGHPKQSSLVKDGVKLDANDLQLTGKAKTALLRDVDAAGMCYRDGDKFTVSFKHNDKDLLIKSRARHLEGKEIVLSEMIGEKLVTYWDRIFPELNKK